MNRKSTTVFSTPHGGRTTNKSDVSRVLTSPVKLKWTILSLDFIRSKVMSQWVESYKRASTRTIALVMSHRRVFRREDLTASGGDDSIWRQLPISAKTDEATSSSPKSRRILNTILICIVWPLHRATTTPLLWWIWRKNLYSLFFFIEFGYILLLQSFILSY